jgi:DNA-binding transcriptional LysR family regulator
MDKLSHIQAFIEISETLSFAEAARRLNLAPSVISKRIADLEDHLRVKLLNRSTRKVQLTDAGFAYADQMRRVLSDLSDAEESLRYAHDNPVGLLRLSAPVSFGQRFLGAAIAGYIAQYPDVRIDLHLTDLMVDVNSGAYDLAIGIGDMPQDNLITRKIAESRRVVVATPQYFSKHGLPQKPQDLLHHNCLSYAHLFEGKRWPFRVNGKTYLQPVQGNLTTNNGMLMLDAVLAGCGVTLLPTFITGTHVLDGRLKIALEDFEDEPMRISAAYPPQRNLSARTRTFIDYLVKYFSGG